ncbi:hypothetical protein [Novipirellula sp.]|uniref:hypothetical protein n=1 Tax=Novipirellula sp. TaxID=2795430 RepID=UPI0035687A80
MINGAIVLRILLLDERGSVLVPFSLVPLSSRVVEELLARVRGRNTVVVVTHHFQRTRQIAD